MNNTTDNSTPIRKNELKYNLQLVEGGRYLVEVEESGILANR
jgi:hypothetical protein